MACTRFRPHNFLPSEVSSHIQDAPKIRPRHVPDCPELCCWDLRSLVEAQDTYKDANWNIFYFLEKALTPRIEAGLMPGMSWSLLSFVLGLPDAR